MRKIELLQDLVGGILPGKRRQQIALLCQLLLKRRKQFFSLRERRVLREHIGLRRLAEAELTLQDIEKVTFDAR